MLAPRFSFALVLAGCGAASQSPDEPTKIVVPTQPPQPPPPSPPPPVVTAAPPVMPPFSCAKGKPFKANQRSYCGYEEAETWHSAESRCVANGGHLFGLETREVSEALHLALGSPLRARRAAWIGLESVNKTKQTWKWSTGQPVVVASWNDKEPNNWDGNEACGELLIANGRWNDTRCDLRQHFICQSDGKTTMNCPATRFGTSKPTSYCFVQVDMSFADAKNACKQFNATLATPQTEEEENDLRRALGQRFEATRMWTGLNDREREGTLRWATGERFDFRSWEPGEPNAFNGREACVELFADRWRWNDLDCTAKLPFVCEEAR